MMLPSSGTSRRTDFSSMTLMSGLDRVLRTVMLLFLGRLLLGRIHDNDCSINRRYIIAFEYRFRFGRGPRRRLRDEDRLLDKPGRRWRQRLGSRLPVGL